MDHVPARTDPAVLDDLHRRLEAFRPVPVVDVGWERGTDPGYLADLVDHWRFAERFFDVRIFDVRPDGGHFGAWERPEVYAEAVRATLALAHRDGDGDGDH